MTTKLILLTCLASTLFMTGLIWFVQVVHYPLFDRVDPGSFRQYHADHTTTTGFVVILPMILELITSALLVVERPERTTPWMVWSGLGLAIATWATTFFLSVPAHNRLAMGFDPDAHQILVTTNRLRVIAWTSHSAILLLMTARSLR